MTDVRLVLMTAPSAEVAGSIVNQLVEERLIACGNITTAVASIYRWQGTVERADEVLVIMKTTLPALEAVRARISELHPYDVPEVLSIAVDDGASAYLEWVRDSVRVEK